MDHIDVTSDYTKELLIMATNACNLHCRYCYESNKNAPSMDVQKIEQQIEQELRLRSKPYSKFIINFHGGEPLLAFEKVRAVVEWCDEHLSDFDISYTTTTNGTILNDEIRDWLVTNKRRFIPILSLDGSKEIHDRNRFGSFDRIDLDFFRTHWPLQGIKMTVSPNTVSDMFDSFLYLYDIGFYPNPSLAKEVDWVLTEHLPIYAQELKKLANFYVTHPGIPPGQLLNLPMHKFSEEFQSKGINSCGAGFDTIAFDIYGNRYPCQTFISDLSKPYNKQEMNHIFASLSQNCHLKISPKCKGCAILNGCSSCYAINYTCRGDMGAIDTVMCAFNEVTFLCAAQMFAEILPCAEKYNWLIKSRNDAELYHSIKGVKQLFKNITNI